MSCTSHYFSFASSLACVDLKSYLKKAGLRNDDQVCSKVCYEGLHSGGLEINQDCVKVLYLLFCWEDKQVCFEDSQVWSRILILVRNWNFSCVLRGIFRFSYYKGSRITIHYRESQLISLKWLILVHLPLLSLQPIKRDGHLQVSHG